MNFKELLTMNASLKSFLLSAKQYRSIRLILRFRNVIPEK